MPAAPFERSSWNPLSLSELSVQLITSSPVVSSRMASAEGAAGVEGPVGSPPQPSISALAPHRRRAAPLDMAIPRP